MEEYQYVATLGEGAYAFLWKCVERATGRHVAIKGFKQAHEEPEILRLAVREVRMLQSLNHPAIIPLIKAFKSKSGRVYMVFPYMSLCAYHLLGDYPDGLPVGQLKLLTWQLIQALSYLHHYKIVHRDIKPGNILMSEAGQVKLCDLGSARPTDGGPRELHPLSSYVTTLWYRAPEVLVGDSYGPSCDIWSLGCTIAELATAKPLFPGNTSGEQLWRIMRCFGPLPDSQKARLAANRRLARVKVPVRGRSLHDRLRYCDAELLRLLESCLQLNPRHRPTAAELLQSPYFASVPQLLAGTFLERVYGDVALLSSEGWQQRSVEQQRRSSEQQRLSPGKQQRSSEKHHQHHQHQHQRLSTSAHRSASAVLSKRRTIEPLDPQGFAAGSTPATTATAAGATRLDLPSIAEGGALTETAASKLGLAVAAAAGTWSLASTNNNLDVVYTTVHDSVPQSYDYSASCMNSSMAATASTLLVTTMDISDPSAQGPDAASATHAWTQTGPSVPNLGYTGRNHAAAAAGGNLGVDGLYGMLPGNVTAAAGAASGDSSGSFSLGAACEEDDPAHDRMYNPQEAGGFCQLCASHSHTAAASTAAAATPVAASAAAATPVDTTADIAPTSAAAVVAAAIAAAAAAVAVAADAGSMGGELAVTAIATAPPTKILKPQPSPSTQQLDGGGRGASSGQFSYSNVAGHTALGVMSALRRLMTADQLTAEPTATAKASRGLPQQDHSAPGEALPQSPLSPFLSSSPQWQRLQPTEPRRMQRSAPKVSQSFVVPKNAMTDAQQRRGSYGTTLARLRGQQAQQAQPPGANDSAPVGLVRPCHDRKALTVLTAWVAESNEEMMVSTRGPGPAAATTAAGPAATAAAGRGTGGGGGGAAPGSKPTGAGQPEVDDMVPPEPEPTDRALASRTSASSAGGTRAVIRVLGGAHAKVSPSRYASSPTAAQLASAAGSSPSMPSPVACHNIDRVLVAAGNSNVSRLTGSDVADSQVLGLRITDGAPQGSPGDSPAAGGPPPSRRLSPPLACPSPSFVAASASMPLMHQPASMGGLLNDDQGSNPGSPVVRTYVRWMTDGEYDSRAKEGIDGTSPASKANGKTKGALTRLFGAVKRAFTNPSKTATSPQ